LKQTPLHVTARHQAPCRPAARALSPVARPPARPPARGRPQYGEFRSGFEGDAEDTRLVWFGLRYILDQHVSRRWTALDVERADAFYATHMAPGHSPFPYPRDLFLKFIAENGGYMPVKLEALPEGTCVHAHVPVFQASAHRVSPAALRRCTGGVSRCTALAGWACRR
jgi:hypothetical protein